MTMKKIYLAEAFAQCCMCGKPGLSTTEGDGGTECQLDDGRWTCSHECWDRAIDPTPALGWLAAREAAVVVAADYTPEKHGGTPLAAHVTGMNIKIAIRALPAPTSAQLMAEAMRLPEIAALVEWLRAKTRDIETHDTKHDIARPDIFVGEILERLAAIKDASHE